MYLCEVTGMFWGAYANNVKCMYTSACGDFVDCSWFIPGIYTDIVVWYLHINLLAHVAFEGDFCCSHIYGNSMVNRSCSLSLFLLICEVMWGLYEDYSGSAVGTCLYNVAGIFVQENMPIMWNVYIPMFLVILLIAVGSYETYIVTYLSHVNMNWLAYVAYI